MTDQQPSLVKLKSMRVDAALENQGTWQECFLIPQAKLFVRSIHYGPFTIARDLLMQKLRRQHGSKPVPDEVLNTSMGALYAQHILLGWEGCEEKYSEELAREMLTDPEYREFVRAVELCAQQAGSAKLEYTGTALKN